MDITCDENNVQKSGLPAPVMSLLEIFQFVFIGILSIPYIVKFLSSISTFFTPLVPGSTMVMVHSTRIWDVFVLLVLTLMVISFFVVSRRRKGSVYIRLEKGAYNDLVDDEAPEIRAIKFRSKENLKGTVKTLGNADIWMSTIFDITANILLRVAWLIVYIRNVRLPFSPKTNAHSSLFYEWNYNIQRIDDSFRKMISAYYLIPNAISISNKYGRLGRFIRRYKASCLCGRRSSCDCSSKD